MMSLGLMEAFAFSLPIVCAMVCMVLMLLDACRYGRGGQERRLRALLALTYLVTSLGWLGALFGRPVRFLVLPSRLFIDVDAGSGDVFLGGIHDNGYRRAAEAESMALGGACLPYGGLVRGRYTGKSRVFYLQYALPGAKPPEHIPLQAVHRRLLVGGATYLLGLAGGRASFYLGLRTRSAGGIVARYGDFLLFLFRVAGGVANVRVLYDALL